MPRYGFLDILLLAIDIVEQSAEVRSKKYHYLSLYHRHPERPLFTSIPTDHCNRSFIWQYAFSFNAGFCYVMLRYWSGVDLSRLSASSSWTFLSISFYKVSRPFCTFRYSPANKALQPKRGKSPEHVILTFWHCCPVKVPDDYYKV